MASIDLGGPLARESREGTSIPPAAVLPGICLRFAEFESDAQTRIEAGFAGASPGLTVVAKDKLPQITTPTFIFTFNFTVSK